MAQRILATLLTVPLLLVGGALLPVKAENAMGYRLLSAQEATALPHNHGSLGMDVERSQEITDGGMTFERSRSPQIFAPVVRERNRLLCKAQDVRWCARARGQCRCAGVTATPERLDGIGLRDAFDYMVVWPDVQELIDAGCLAPFRYLGPAAEAECLTASNTAVGEASWRCGCLLHGSGQDRRREVSARGPALGSTQVRCSRCRSALRRTAVARNAAKFRDRTGAFCFVGRCRRWRKAMLGNRLTSGGEKAIWPVAARLPLRSHGGL
jgi:hypothetical protein